MKSVSVKSSPIVEGALISFNGDIGECQNFAILVGSTVTFDGEPCSVPIGNVGVSPGTSITVATGTILQVIKSGIEEINTPSANSCALSRLTVIASGLAATCTGIVTSLGVLNGLSLPPGVYCHGTFSMAAGATVYLNGTGVTNPQWVFVAGTTFITGIKANIVIIGGNPSNVFWVLGTSATIGAYTQMKGTILAKAAITLNTGASVIGHALAGTALTCASNCDVSAYSAPIVILTGIFMYLYIFKYS